VNRCAVCSRDPDRMNNGRDSECSHVDCPHRRRAWSERPSPAELFRGPWPKREDVDPTPIDVELKKEQSK